MNRDDDTSAHDQPMPAYDDQGNLVNRDNLDQDERDALGLSEQEDDEML